MELGAFVHDIGEAYTAGRALDKLTNDDKVKPIDFFRASQTNGGGRNTSGT
jgi:hypothetical protein